jgi:hypothetical protein
MVIASATSSINLSIVIASSEGDVEEEGGSEVGEDEGSDNDEPEPEPEPEPAPKPTPEPITEPAEPIVPEPEPPTECPEGMIVSDTDSCVPDPEAAKSAVQQPTELPLCDGSPRNCITANGDICLVGQGGHECECAEDMSDCPMHPSLPPLESPSPKPLPYCDLVDEDYTGACHDRKDYDEDTLLYPCNDGTQKEDWRDCEDAYEPPCNPESDENCQDYACPTVIGTDCIPGPRCNEGYELIEEKCVKEDDDDDEEHKVIIKKINIHRTIHNTADFPEIDIIGLSLKDTGEAMVCAINIDSDWVQCQEFGVPEDRINENIWRVIETDQSKDYDSGNTGSEEVDDAITAIKSHDFTELDDLNNHEFDIDLAAVGINPVGDGLVCLINDPEGTALCEPFKVSNQAISGQITEITEINE